MRAGALLVIALTFAAPLADARVNPRLKNVHKIYVGALAEPPRDPAKLAKNSPEHVRRKILDSLVSSGRFAVVREQAKADAELEGTVGYIASEKDGQTYSSGYAHLELVEAKSGEVVWIFDYKRQPGATGYASDRVARQFIEKLLADAETADKR